MLSKSGSVAKQIRIGFFRSSSTNESKEHEVNGFNTILCCPLGDRFTIYSQCNCDNPGARTCFFPVCILVLVSITVLHFPTEQLQLKCEFFYRRQEGSSHSMPFQPLATLAGFLKKIHNCDKSCNRLVMSTPVSLSKL